MTPVGFEPTTRGASGRGLCRLGYRVRTRSLIVIERAIPTTPMGLEPTTSGVTSRCSADVELRGPVLHQAVASRPKRTDTLAAPAGVCHAQQTQRHPAASEADGSRQLRKACAFRGFRGNRPGPPAADAANDQTLSGPAASCDIAAGWLAASTRVDSRPVGLTEHRDGRPQSSWYVSWVSIEHRQPRVKDTLRFMLRVMGTPAAL